MTRSATRTLWFPLILLLGISTTVFLGFYIFDWISFGDGRSLWSTLFHFDIDTLQNALGNMAQVVAAVLGIVITVVSIVVQLAATRYTPRIADLFFRDNTNLGVLGFFVVACINAVWVSVSVGKSFIPQASIISTMVLVTASLLLMVPYFAYVFAFLDPERVVGRIQAQAVSAALESKSEVESRQRSVLTGVEQLADVAINAVSQKDKAIASGSIDALKDLLVQYLERKKTLDAEWFHIGRSLRANPDFVALAPESTADLIERRIWLEWKVLRQFQSIYNESLGSMPDVSQLIAIDTRYVGESALGTGAGRGADDQAIALTIKFFNTYLRATINAREVRTAYNVLNQYRQLAESALGTPGCAAIASGVATHFRYYGQLAHSMNLGFVTETAAYDLATLCERAFVGSAAGVSADVHGAILKALLELDPQDPVAGSAAAAGSKPEMHEDILRGVRKAQVRLATFYLNAGPAGAPYAQTIFRDMVNERPERLRSIFRELEQVESKDFWEVIDRGTNFDYLEEDRKAQLHVFSSWFQSLNIVAGA